MPNTRVPAIQQRLRANAESICFKCFHRNVCRAIDNQPCIECNHFTYANGVTVQQWIPVTEGMPELIPCGAGTAYSEAVNVLTSGRKVLTAIWDGFDWTCDAEFWDAEDEEITYWTPVLLPLPEPSKGLSYG